MAILGKGKKSLEDKFPLSDEERQLGRQFEAAKQVRRKWQTEWQMCEASLLDIGPEGGPLRSSDVENRYSGNSTDEESRDDIIENWMGINLSARNLQLIFSQLMSNTPVAMAIPNSNEPDDVDSAKLAEFTLSWGRKRYTLDNFAALGVHNVFTYGNGSVKQLYDKTLGAFMARMDGTATTIGDHTFSIPTPWDIYLDANCTDINQLTKVFERIFMDVDQVCEFFKDHKDLVIPYEDLEDVIKGYIIDGTEVQTSDLGVQSLLSTIKVGQVEIFEYWEAGTPANGYLGKLIYMFKDGRIIAKSDNPVSFSMVPKEDGGAGKARKARLPYSFLTYEDVPNSAYGRTPAAKCARAQNLLNGVYEVMLQTAKAMGIPVLIVNEESLGDSANSALSDNPMTVVPIDVSGEAGGQQPYKLQPASTSGDFKILSEFYANYINETWGINDALLGKQQRETSGINTQLSIMQGNMIRERLFQKYVYFIQDIYELFLSFVVSNWKTDRILRVVGEDNKVCVEALKGASIEGGYTLKIERNLVFALDPITRQEQIMNLQPFFAEAGVDPRFMLKQLRLADLRGLYDEFEQADNRAKKNIEFIKATGKQAPIRKHEDHIGIMAYLKRYVMKEEYYQLDEGIKDLIDANIEKRAEIEASTRVGEAPAPALPAGQPPLDLMGPPPIRTPM